jgi:hypothetical protein
VETGSARPLVKGPYNTLAELESLGVDSVFCDNALKLYMGYDIDSRFKRQCMCGAGEFIVEIYSPDHPYRTRSRIINTDITCSSCKSNFSIHTLYNQIGIVRNSVLTLQQQLEKECRKFERDLLEDPVIIDLFAQFHAELCNKRSVAEVHRWLSSARLTLESLSTFRKRWRGAEDWVQNNMRAWQVKGIIDLLGFNDERIQNKLLKLQDLLRAVRETVQFVGPPICTLE